MNYNIMCVTKFLLSSLLNFAFQVAFVTLPREEVQNPLVPVSVKNMMPGSHSPEILIYWSEIHQDI